MNSSDRHRSSDRSGPEASALDAAAAAVRMPPDAARERRLVERIHADSREILRGYAAVASESEAASRASRLGVVAVLARPSFALSAAAALGVVVLLTSLSGRSLDQNLPALVRDSVVLDAMLAPRAEDGSLLGTIDDPDLVSLLRVTVPAADGRAPDDATHRQLTAEEDSR